MKPNIKKLDNVDVVFVDTPWTAEETKAFSEYIKIQKSLLEKRAVVAPSSRPHSQA